MSMIIIIFLTISILITILVSKISEKKEDEYMDMFDVPFYGNIEELMPYVNQSKKMDVKELIDGVKLNDRYIGFSFKRNKKKSQ